MEDSSQWILEVSSDEDVGFGEPREFGGYGVGCGGFGDRDDCDWLSELLGEVGGNKDGEVDDVVLVSETLANPPKKSIFESLKPSSIVVDDDDDCVVLDGDPDKPVVAAENCRVADGCVGVGDDDDVEIVGEKGEVACRDFPHARHLCVKFLFASTPHAAHCSQCHCYVCDSLAPCSHWGTGVSSIDHCHATDKDGYWKTERKRIKIGGKSAPAVYPCSIPNTSHLRAFFQPKTQASSLAPQWSKSPFPNSPILCPVKAQLSCGPTAVQPFPVIRAPRSQLSNILKRPGMVGASSPSNIHLPEPRSTNPLKRCRVLNQTPISTHQWIMGARIVRPVQRFSFSQNNNNVGHANYLHFPQPQFQPYMNATNFVSTTAHLQPSVFRPKIYVPSQNAIGSELNSIFMIPSNQCAGINNLANQSSQPQTHGNPNSSLFNMQSDIQRVNNHPQNGINANKNDLAWDYSSLFPGNMQAQEAIQQSQSSGLFDNSQVQSVVEPVVENNYQQQDVNNNGSCQFPESTPNGTFDFIFDSLMFENNLLLGVSEVPVSPPWNGYSPKSASVDTGSLFDF